MADGHGRTAIEVGVLIVTAAAGIVAAIGGAVYGKHPDGAVALWATAGALFWVAVVIFLGYFVIHPFALFLDRKRVEWIASGTAALDAAKARRHQTGRGVVAPTVIDVLPDPSRPFQIVSARYGAADIWTDVSWLVQANISPDGRLFVDNDTMGGDPIHGVEKELVVQYRVRGGSLQETTVPEGGNLVLG